jgi:predicted metalloprotease with PDZ domain
MSFKKSLFIVCCLFAYCAGFALDNTYHYSIDITRVSDKRLQVELIPPQLVENKIIFSLPRIVPGTYAISDYGRFVDDLEAFDAAGKSLSVQRIDTNSWQISNSNRLARITYKVRDTYHASRRDNPVFEPGGTDFEPDTCFVLNLHTLLGYFRNHTKQAYELNVTHQPTFYGSTSLTDLDNSNTKDQYQIATYNEAVDNPIMYSRPDTAHIKVGESDILISLYSPSKRSTAKAVAIQLDTLLQAQGKYLGGRLPVQRYSFLIYLADHEGLGGGFGALEHSYCSMYYLIDEDISNLAGVARDVAAHEFFHIVTPLNIHSEEIANFDFDKPEMSEHLWLYEGSTEYHAHLVQVRYNLISQAKYLDVIKQKMNEASIYNDSLSFTEMSRGCLDTFKDQYNNVYAKGMLISMCLDLKLLRLSDGKYGLMDLIDDLSKSYGKDKAFRDEELIPKIVSLTSPEIRTFFDDYVVGAKTLPFEELLGYAGVNYDRVRKSKSFSLGQVDLGFNPITGHMMVVGLKNMNDFGHALGYREGDEIYKINGKKVRLMEFRSFRENWMKTVKEGDKVSVSIYRKSPKGKSVKMTLKAKAFKSEVPSFNALEFNTAATADQLRIRKAWLDGAK